MCCWLGSRHSKKKKKRYDHFLCSCFSTSFFPPWLTASLLPASLAALLHLLDRQAERTRRTDFLWRTKLSSEEEGVDTMRGINKILLENILPAHVAEHYLLQVRGVGVGLGVGVGVGVGGRRARHPQQVEGIPPAVAGGGGGEAGGGGGGSGRGSTGEGEMVRCILLYLYGKPSCA